MKDRRDLQLLFAATLGLLLSCVSGHSEQQVYVSDMPNIGESRVTRKSPQSFEIANEKFRAAVLIASLDGDGSKFEVFTGIYQVKEYEIDMGSTKVEIFQDDRLVDLTVKYQRRQDGAIDQLVWEMAANASLVNEGKYRYLLTVACRNISTSDTEVEAIDVPLRRETVMVPYSM